ncbi:MAG TPA: FG-GAP-like repeat-containing protein [Pyrinomonadaceae bacterium]|nr:FG-GAP-like repeat-containing protein [Pyrinomonadaceae bacterium]
MSNSKVSTRRVVLSVAVVCLAAMGLIIGAQFYSADANSAASIATPAAVFPGTNTGAIPDGAAQPWPNYGAARTIDFAVSGITGNVSEVAVDFTGTHTWVGDIDVVLRAPGGTPSMVVVSRIGVTAGTADSGDSSNYGGAYAFTDTAVGANIWTVAGGTCGTSCVVTAGNYRSVAPGQAGQSFPAPVTSLNTAFAGLTPAQANGTWTLSFRDGAAGDIGSITASNLTVNAGATPLSTDAPVDFNGDNRSDYAVVRNTGGGATGQITWYYAFSSGGAPVAFDWGLASDFFVPEDYDNDNKDDIAVWRSGAPGTAAFYIFNSATSTVRVEAFGQTGDDPSVVDDYNNDGAADLAVYRGGVNPGNQSTWYYRTTPGGPVTFVQWGLSGDVPAPGDYDGDGSADFVVQRSGGGGAGAFYRRFSSGGNDSFFFGADTDLIAPGDYDDDGKADICVVRITGANWTWYFEPSGTPGITSVQHTFGTVATDFPTQGDFDGDGRTEIAIWRNNGAFWIFNLQTVAVSVVSFGTAGDYPVANFNVH